MISNMLTDNIFLRVINIEKLSNEHDILIILTIISLIYIIKYIKNYR